VSTSRSLRVITALGLVAAAGTLFAAVAVKPAQALPSYKTACSNCHSATPSGTVTATPSKATLNPGEAYAVKVAVNLSAGGKTGFWITTGGAGTADPNVSGGPGASPLTANMTAPAKAGTYTYKVYGVKSTTKPSSGQTATTTFSITVSGGGGGVTDTTAPTTVAPSAASVKKGKTVTLNYQVNDPSPNLGTATATIQIKNAAGAVVKTVRAGAKPINTPQKASFKCTLAKGTYTFVVSAVDAAGNASTTSASNRLTVK
jgi:hypothetical protein